MTDAGLNFKSPGGKEAIVAGGAALGLALIYFTLSKKPATSSPAAVPASGHGLGAAPASQDYTPGGSLLAAGGPFTGNAFTDANVAAPPTSPPSGPVRAPVLHVTQGAQEILGRSGGSSLNAGAPGLSSSGGGGGPVPGGAPAVYHALVNAGLLPFQAAGVLGNIQNESAFNPEAVGDQGTSFGLIQWHNTTYPNAAGYVTGNVQKDFQNQVQAIAHLFKQQNIGGTTAAQVGGNFASQVEGCVGCQPGGSQYNQRVANASAIWQQITAGKFTPPAAKPKPKTSPGVKAASPAQIRNLFPVIKPKPQVKPAGRPPAVRAAPLGGGYAAFLRAIRAPVPHRYEGR